VSSHPCQLVLGAWTMAQKDGDGGGVESKVAVGKSIREDKGMPFYRADNPSTSGTTS
jgi:hypothetical protein